MSERTNKKWNHNDDELLKTLAVSCNGLLEISLKLNRSLNSVQSRIYKLASEDGDFNIEKIKLLEREKIYNDKCKKGSWSVEEDEVLSNMINTNEDMFTMSKKLNRTYASIKGRISKLNIASETKLSDEEKEKILKLYGAGLPIKDIANDIKRSIPAIKNVLKNNGITMNSRKWNESDVKAMLFLISQNKDIDYISDYLGKTKNAINKKITEIGIVIDDEIDYICERCFEKMETHKYDIESKMCVDCKKELLEIENYKKIIEIDEEEKSDKIKAYINRNSKRLSYCGKCNESKNVVNDYYFSIAKDGFVNSWCKKCKNSKREARKLKSLSVRGY